MIVISFCFAAFLCAIASAGLVRWYWMRQDSDGVLILAMGLGCLAIAMPFQLFGYEVEVISYLIADTLIPLGVLIQLWEKRGKLK